MWVIIACFRIGTVENAILEIIKGANRCLNMRIICLQQASQTSNKIELYQGLICERSNAYRDYHSTYQLQGSITDLTK